MRPINVEITLGHDNGISASYYKPTENEVLEDYLKAEDILTIYGSEKKLLKQVQEMKEKNKDNEYIINGKLQERDKQIEFLMQRQGKTDKLIQSLIDSGQISPKIKVLSLRDFFYNKRRLKIKSCKKKQ